MIHVKLFTFNAFSENTYVLYDEQGSALIIDPGCNDGNERKMLETFIKKEGLRPTLLINTHCHIDHVLGNKWCKETFDIPLWVPLGEEMMLSQMMRVADMYAIKAEASPSPDHLMTDADTIPLGEMSWTLLSAPGHSPASICLYQASEQILIAGDVLFYESIGRTDLPGGNHQLLLQNIHQKLFTLPDTVSVYPGHGPSTTIGHERMHNPFLN
ncbi:MAG: MBL fold metallo-hydrolase [Saprospiraceae bacterium]|jgi:glyoxylase-like metal-dependent hydrolase (beta-lactamase superfamily II)|nr:MBL fold metallo-hydrolase [Saprospiraceae bacterium]MBK7373160.1 MBL fold metallo-hydrolase [Saprospiraceae bacterium]MBK7439921.1 MBL fold metallo-hydrolase [Saprospiraceae bacterium]MBK8280393.1 MBL fold metallo-hydrolase [Saprospiraceae bacterium]MBK8513143.1 MBL fold metallo-hydrolase [Saprospiraceae bacterium]